jgi:hypothetical protein
MPNPYELPVRFRCVTCLDRQTRDATIPTLIVPREFETLSDALTHVMWHAYTNVGHPANMTAHVDIEYLVRSLRATERQP